MIYILYIVIGKEADILHKKKALLKYLSSLLLFGSNGIVASCIALPSYDIVLLRTLIGGLLLAAIFLFSGRRPAFLTQRRALFFLAVSGAAMGGSWILLYEAYRLIGVSIASLAYYCGPVIVMALSPLLFGEPLTRPRMAGFAIVLCGVFLVNGQALQGGQSPVGLIYGGIAPCFMRCWSSPTRRPPPSPGWKMPRSSCSSAFSPWRPSSFCGTGRFCI